MWQWRGYRRGGGKAGAMEIFRKFGNFARLTKICLGRTNVLVQIYCDLYNIHWTQSLFIVFNVHIL